MDDTARRRAELTEAENRIKCKEFLLDNKQYPAALLDLYDTKDFEAFKANAEKLLKAFPQLDTTAAGKVPKFTRKLEAPAGTASRQSLIDAVFKPKF